jgi:uncharacterized membrane protein
MRENAHWNDERTEIVIGNLLRAGVTLAAALAIAGAIVYLARHGGERPDRSVFRGEPADLRSISGILRDAFALRGRGLIQLGLLVLIATPVARVAFSVYAFLRERDWLYVGVTLLVLAMLVYSLGVGRV